jgi:hydroxyethylthiazole kinase-like uncharacterized protein yjeF
METFDPSVIKNIYKPSKNSSKGDNGQVTIIGGSSLFHGAPIFALTTASRVVDMLFFASPEPSVGKVAEQIKAKLSSFIWIGWGDLNEYIQKSDACLIGPGLMRSEETREITREILNKFSDKRWVIDAGSLQTMDTVWIPKDSILTPNKKEYEHLFDAKCQIDGGKFTEETVTGLNKNAKKYKCTIVLKGATTVVSSPDKVLEVPGGNAGLTKGGSGDCEAGLTVALLAKNDAFLAACTASYIVKESADSLFKGVGPYYNSDDLGLKVPETLFKYTK